MRPGRVNRWASRRGRFRFMGPAAMSCVVLVSCTHSEEKVRVHTALIEPTTFCVAPILNFSDELTLDSIKLAELLASELTYVDGATVLPVSRVVAALASRGRTQIESTEDALAIAEAVGADAIIVTGITEYDAYTPIIGVAMQIYSVRRPVSMGMDPSTMARGARPTSMVSDLDDPRRPTGEVQVIYNANHAYVVDAVKAYADDRKEDLQMGYQQYLKVQTLYIRFVWHNAVTRLLAQQRCLRTELAGLESMEHPI